MGQSVFDNVIFIFWASCCFRRPQRVFLKSEVISEVTMLWHFVFVWPRSFLGGFVIIVHDSWVIERSSHKCPTGSFCLFHSERDATLFFNYINNQHPNIRFTMERETDHVLPFLDVLINNTDPHQSVTTVYRDKTFTGLLTSYLSFCSFTYKLHGVNQKPWFIELLR